MSFNAVTELLKSTYPSAVLVAALATWTTHGYGTHDAGSRVEMPAHPELNEPWDACPAPSRERSIETWQASCPEGEYQRKQGG